MRAVNRAIASLPEERITHFKLNFHAYIFFSLILCCRKQITHFDITLGANLFYIEFVVFVSGAFGSVGWLVG